MRGMPFRLPLLQKYDVSTVSPDFMFGKFSETRSARKPLKTTGSSVTVAAVTAADGPLDELALGDELSVNRDGSWDTVFLATKVDGDGGTVDTAVNWQTGPGGTSGRAFQFRKFLSGITSADGWFDARNVEALKIQVIVTTLNATSITFRVEGRIAFAQQTNTLIQDKTFTATGSDFIDVTRMLDANWDQVRLGVQVSGDVGVQSVSAVAMGVA